jgi:hypothetical protein
MIAILLLLNFDGQRSFREQAGLARFHLAVFGHSLERPIAQQGTGAPRHHRPLCGLCPGEGRGGPTTSARDPDTVVGDAGEAPLAAHPVDVHDDARGAGGDYLESFGLATLAEEVAGAGGTTVRTTAAAPRAAWPGPTTGSLGHRRRSHDQRIEAQTHLSGQPRLPARPHRSLGPPEPPPHSRTHGRASRSACEPFDRELPRFPRRPLLSGSDTGEGMPFDVDVSVGARRERGRRRRRGRGRARIPE